MTPVLVEFSTATTDTWLRLRVRGLTYGEVQIHRVIVETMAEADRLLREIATLKYARRQPYGGGSYQRVSR